MSEVVEFVDAGLKTDKNTVREHGKRNVEVIHDSIEETGFLRSIVVDEENQVLAGKGVSMEAGRRGAKILYVDVDDPNTLVAVRRKGLTETQKQRAMLWDNHASDLSKNNRAAINRLVQEHPEQRLLEGIFSPKEQQDLLRASAHAQPLAPGGIDEDDDTAEVEQEAPRVTSSNIKMIPLHCTVETHAVLVRQLRELYEMLGTRSITDTIVAVVAKAHAEWMPAEEETV